VVNFAFTSFVYFVYRYKIESFMYLLCIIFRHSATLFDSRLVVFGGWDAPVCYNDLFILDLSKFGFSVQCHECTKSEKNCSAVAV